MSNNQEKLYYFYILWLLFFLFFSNQHYSYDEIIAINQTDSHSYMAIAISAPDYSSEILPYHKAQRFFVPYLVGILSKLLNVNILYIFKILNIITMLSIIFLHCRIIEKFKLNSSSSIIFISALILNPYLFRYSIAVPTMINDLVFVLSIYLFLYAIVINKNTSIYPVFLSLISRQNGMFIFLANIIYNFFNLRFKYFKSLNFFYTIIIFIFIFILANSYAENVSTSNFNFKHAYGIFEWILSSWDFLTFLKWITLPFYSYLPLLVIFIFFFKIKEYDKSYLKNYLIFFFLFFSIIGMSILPGPIITGRNIIRLTTLAYPILIIFLAYFAAQKKNFSKINLLAIIVLLHIWSLHPRYSKISLFEIMRGYLL